MSEEKTGGFKKRNLGIFGSIFAVLAFIIAEGPQALSTWTGTEIYYEDGIKMRDVSKAGNANGNAETASGTSATGGAGGTQVASTIDAPIDELFEIDRIEIEDQAVGSADTERQACSAAIKAVDRKLGKLCDRIAIEQKAAAASLETDSKQCKTCGVSGQQWRCVSYQKSECVLQGGHDD